MEANLKGRKISRGVKREDESREERQRCSGTRRPICSGNVPININFTCLRDQSDFFLKNISENCRTFQLAYLPPFYYHSLSIVQGVFEALGPENMTSVKNRKIHYYSKTKCSFLDLVSFDVTSVLSVGTYILLTLRILRDV